MTAASTMTPAHGLEARALERRAWLARGAACLAGASAGWPAHAAMGDAQNWLPYRADQMMRIEPHLTARAPGATPATVRIEPVITDFVHTPAPKRAGAGSAGGLPPLGSEPPRAYVRTGRQYGVEPWLLYGVALQESQLKFGNRTLPYPWTLCVRGQGLRFGSYAQTLAALRERVGSGITNVDCGAMQVNWHWHSDKLGSFERALDPYPNLAVGARILRAHFDASGNWRQAVAHYHTGGDPSAQARRRGARYAEQALARLERLGVRASALPGGQRG